MLRGWSACGDAECPATGMDEKRTKQFDRSRRIGEALLRKFAKLGVVDGSVGRLGDSPGWGDRMKFRVLQSQIGDAAVDVVSRRPA